MGWLPWLALVGCGEDEDGSGSKGPPVDCREDASPLVRVPVGSVRTLPAPLDPTCPDPAWELVASPGANGLVRGVDGRARFVPDAAGTWVFEGADGRSVSVEVVDEAPYHGLFHPPSRSLVAVGGEVWAAQGYAPAVARLDGDDLRAVGEIDVGSWPVALAATPDGATVVVAQAGDDHLGVIDVAAGRMVDAVWVGDEPAGVVVSPDGRTAYVALSTVPEVAVVDLVARARTGALPAPMDGRALALTADGETLYVAGHRTGAPDRFPWGVDERATDVLAVDTATGAVVATFPEVASTVTDLELDEAGRRLLVSGTVSHPERGLVTPDEPPFEGTVSSWDLDSGARIAASVLAPGGGAPGMVLGPQALARDGSELWVVAEGSSLAVALDFETLEEVARFEVPGHPRDVLAASGRVYAHGSQDFAVHRLSLDGVDSTGAAGTDPRPEAVARGQRGFVSPGESYGANYSCNSCHTDGRGDTRVWPAGPFEVWEASRAMFWLEGTAPLGWSGYVADVRTFGYTGYTSIIAKWPTTDEAEDLATFLGSLMPPAAANSYTLPSGGLSPAGVRGRELFVASSCATCHPGPLLTDNRTLPEGLTPEVSSTPSLVGVYRHNVWLKRADVSSLRDSVVAALEFLGNDRLSEAELDDLTRYLAESTDRDLFLLAREPLADAPAVSVDSPIHLTFNQPLWDSATNRSRVALWVADEEVDARVAIDGRRIEVTPARRLPHDAAVSVVVAGGLEAFDGRTSAEPTEVSFRTAAAPALELDGPYELVVDLPAIDFEAGGFDPSRTLQLRSELLAEASPGGAALDLDLGRGLRWATAAVVEGTTLHVPPFPLSFGFSMAQGGALEAELVDLDGDGVADAASGVMGMSGPGFVESGLTWALRRPAGCEPGPDGDLAVDVSVVGGVPVVDWGDAGALGLYVTAPDATLPLGPGQTVDGEAYWVLEATTFPVGFSGPVTYGQTPALATDASEVHGGEVAGAPLVAGRCYRFSVITDRFQSGSFTWIAE